MATRRLSLEVALSPEALVFLGNPKRERGDIGIPFSSLMRRVAKLYKISPPISRYRGTAQCLQIDGRD
ncbi:hypothetical protein Pan14r_12480 [Crateriforma conspicua]|uniref:Uncharacterized protein n=1 Tax=Crateriforma conspicua TaxID=2527996 RepID=A0A5C5Y174_9PLAN|nr:hypothetical protein Pan14r_12480 [Crateriforma conspicua]